MPILQQAFDPETLLANASVAICHIDDNISRQPPNYDAALTWVDEAREALSIYRLCRNEGMEEPYTPHHESGDAYATNLESTLDGYVEFLETK